VTTADQVVHRYTQRPISGPVHWLEAYVLADAEAEAEADADALAEADALADAEADAEALAEAEAEADALADADADADDDGLGVGVGLALCGGSVGGVGQLANAKGVAVGVAPATGVCQGV
jgi:membrane protein involved in colicin uptake